MEGITMTKWQYEFIRIKCPKLLNTRTDLAAMGKKGWELVSVDNGIAYFKRPIEPKDTKIETVDPSIFGKFQPIATVHQKPLIDAVGKPLDDPK